MKRCLLSPARAALAFMLVAACLFSGCDAFGSESEKKEASEVLTAEGKAPLTLQVFQQAAADSTGGDPKTRVLGDFEAPWRAFTLEGAAQVPLSFERNVQMGWPTKEDAEAVLFVVMLPEERSGIGSSDEARARALALNAGGGSALGGTRAFEGTAYFFFVEGIGEELSTPSEVEVRPDGDSTDARHIEVRPSEHTIPHRAALSIERADLNAQFQEPISTGIALRNPLYYEYDRPQKRLPFLPVIADRNGITYKARTFPGNASGYGQTYTKGAGARLPDDFELHVFMVPYDR